jgi:hypothetical protein
MTYSASAMKSGDRRLLVVDSGTADGDDCGLAAAGAASPQIEF